MNVKIALLGFLLSGFFAVACLRAAAAPASERARSALGLFRFPGRLERLRHSRWQWFSLVALMLVLRLQGQLPPVLEVMAALELVLFLALPTSDGIDRDFATGSDALRRRGGIMSRRSVNGGE